MIDWLIDWLNYPLKKSLSIYLFVCFEGDLTTSGWVQSVSLGRAFRSAYSFRRDPFVLHSNVQRTSKAVQGFLTGYYKDDEYVGVKDLFQIEDDYDFTIVNYDRCPGLEEYDKQYEANLPKSLKEKRDSLIEEVADAIRIEKENVDLNGFSDCAIYSQCLKLDNQINKQLTEKVCLYYYHCHY